MADDFASGSAQPPKQVWSRCAPCPLEWLAPAGLEPLPPASHIQRREVCSRVSSTRGYSHKTVGAKQTPTGDRRVLRRERENSACRSATRLRPWLKFGEASVGYSTQLRFNYDASGIDKDRPDSGSKDREIKARHAVRSRDCGWVRDSAR